MNIASTLPPAGTTATGSAAAGSTSIAGDLKSFLQLLTTQLRNQDPLAPTDSTQFVTQLAMFAQAEQSVNTNRRLDEIAGVVRGQALANASSFLGREVVVPSDTLAFDGSTPARFSYTVPAGARSVSLEILDETGKVVRSVKGELAAGPYDDAWDGTLDGGRKAAPGRYGLRVVAEVDGARPATVASLTLETSVVGRVDEIRVIEGQVMAVVGGREVPVHAIAGLAEAPASPPAAPASGG